MCICLPFCFPCSAEVWTFRSVQKIPELKTYDRVLSVDIGQAALRLKPTKFYTYLHHDPDAEAEFLAIQAGDAELLISSEHLLFLDNKIAVPAKDIRIGDTLLQVRRDDLSVTPAVVTSINRKQMKGIFAPLTKSGVLVVNGFLVSCYAHVRSHALGHASLSLLRAWYFQKQKWSRKDMSSDTVNGDPPKFHKFAKFLLSVCKILPKPIRAGAITLDLDQIPIM